MAQPYLSMVIPVFNEERRLARCFEQLDHYFNTKKISYEVVFVNDGSKDKTRQILEQKITSSFNYRLLNNGSNRGKGQAVRRGVRVAQGRLVLFADADFSTPLQQLDKLLLHIKDFPVVIGSRYLRSDSIKIKQPMVRRMISRVGSMLTRLILALPYADTQCGFKLFQNQVAKDIFSRSLINGWGFDMEILAIAKLRRYAVKEVAVDWYDDPQSSLRAGRAAWNTLKELLKIRWNIISKRY